jgi:cardiolipin synthase
MGLSEFRALPWWVLGFWALGVLALFTAIVSLFFALGRRPRRTWASELPPVTSRDFLVGISGLVSAPLHAGGSVQVLNNGDEFFPSMLEAIRGARRSVSFSVYIWEPGKVSDLFFDALIDRARAGVTVRLLLDGLGGIRAPQAGLDALRAAGGRIHRFRPPQLGRLTRFHQRNHRRAIVIDGLVGFTGGAAVGDKWLGDAGGPDEWRDCMFRVTGPLARSLQSAFATLWASCAGEMLVGDDHYPPVVAPPEGETVSYHTAVASSPASEDHPLRVFYMLSFLAARESLYITTPYFVPDAQTRGVVATRARLGVDVRILVPNQLTDAIPIRLAGHSYFEDLLAAGVKIYEYQPAMMHAKTVVVDGVWSIVGSANMDIRSKELNQENVLGILDEGLGRQLQETFLQDLRHAERIDLARWRKRSLWQRAKERACVLFAEQY